MIQLSALTVIDYLSFSVSSVPEHRRSGETATHLKHLSGDDNGFSNNIALGNHHLLGEEDLAGRNLDTQITTSNHNAVGRFQNLIEILDSLLILDLYNNFDIGTVGTKDLTDVLDILSATDEGSEDHVHAVFDTELQIFFILVRESREVNVRFREVDTLARAEGSVVESPDCDIGPVDRQNEERKDT